VVRCIGRLKHEYEREQYKATTKVAAPGRINDQRKQIGLGTDLAKHSSNII
jgi:hypothetical protein